MAADTPNPPGAARPAAAAPIRTFFLPVARFDATVAARDAYLQQSDARSHAAKVSHARLKRKQEQKSGRDFYRNALDPSPQPPRRKSPDTSVSWPRFDAANWHVRAPSTLGNVPQCLCHGGLDPFLKIADDVRTSDRLQLQSYLATSAETHQGYKRSNFCPTRDILIPKLAMSAALVQCILLISDYASRATNLTIEARRGQVIQQIRSSLLRPETHALPSTAVAIATLIVAEYRGGEMEAVKFHCRGLKSWVDARGGLDAIDAYFDPFTIMALLVAFVYFDVPIFDTFDMLNAALDRLQLPPVRPPAVPETLKKYCYPSEIGSQVAVLYLLSTIQRLGLDDVLRELAHRLQESVQVAPGAMVYMVLSAAWKYRRTYAALSTRSIVEFVSLLSLSAPWPRRRVLGGLSRQLTGAEGPQPPVDALKEEIRTVWAERSTESSPGSAGQPRSPSDLPLRNASDAVRGVCPYMGHARLSPPETSQSPSPPTMPGGNTGDAARRVCPYIPSTQPQGS